MCRRNYEQQRKRQLQQAVLRLLHLLPGHMLHRYPLRMLQLTRLGSKGEICIITVRQSLMGCGFV